MTTPAYLTAGKAADLLGVKPQTLFAYVSRGLLRSLPGPDARSRRYLRADVERLRSGRGARRVSAIAAPLRWGEPLIDSSVAWITESGPVYRGHPAVELSRRDVPFESVAALLWSGASLRRGRPWTTAVPGASLAAVGKLIAPEASPIAAMSVLVAWAAASEALGPPAAEDDLALARSLTLLMAVAPALPSGPRRVQAALEVRSVAGTLAMAVGAPRSETATAALNRALVLVADHELNASTFAVRVAASTGAALPACLLAGLAALSGPLHGGSAERIGALLDGIEEPRRAGAVVRGLLERGEPVPGFRHPLYPGGDPRAAPLLEMAAEIGGDRPRVEACLALSGAVERIRGHRPNVDLGLAALAAALGLPSSAATAVFAVGRSAGWVAHALEQREAGVLLRPRARLARAD